MAESEMGEITKILKNAKALWMRRVVWMRTNALLPTAALLLIVVPMLTGAPPLTAAPPHPLSAASAISGVRSSAETQSSAKARLPAATPRLGGEQSRIFLSWFLRIAIDQTDRGPNPRWFHRDCAGLVRFAVNEALREHTFKWRKANGFVGQALPPEVRLAGSQRTLFNNWRQPGGGEGAYVSALALIQENTRFVSKDINQARPGDLLFFDQGDSQHVMIWLDGQIIYHTGTVTEQDTGLRRRYIHDLITWEDTRWRPTYGNPNFIGFFRFSFLSS